MPLWRMVVVDRRKWSDPSTIARTFSGAPVEGSFLLNWDCKPRRVCRPTLSGAIPNGNMYTRRNKTCSMMVAIRVVPQAATRAPAPQDPPTTPPPSAFPMVAVAELAVRSLALPSSSLGRTPSLVYSPKRRARG